MEAEKAFEVVIDENFAKVEDKILDHIEIVCMRAKIVIKKEEIAGQERNA